MLVLIFVELLIAFVFSLNALLLVAAAKAEVPPADVRIPDVVVFLNLFELLLPEMLVNLYLASSWFNAAISFSNYSLNLDLRASSWLSNYLSRSSYFYLQV